MTVSQPNNPNSNRDNQFGVVRKKLLSPLPSDTRQGMDQVRQWLTEAPEDPDLYNLIMGVAKESPALNDEIHNLLQSIASKGHVVAAKAIEALDEIEETSGPNVGDSNFDQQNPVSSQLSTEQLLMNQAEDAYYAAEFEKAIPLYQQVLQLRPDNQRAKQQLGKAELNRYTGKPGSNIPREAMRYYRQARSFIAAKDFNQAIKLLNEAVEEAHKQGGEFPEANMALNRLQDLLTASDYVLKAETSAKTGNWENALDQYKRALTLDPTDESSIKMRDRLQNLLSAEALLDPLGIQLSTKKNEKLKSIGIALGETEKIKEIVNTERYQKILATHALYQAETDLHNWGIFAALAPQSQLLTALHQSKGILGTNDLAITYVEEKLGRFKPVRIFFFLLLIAIITLIIFQLLILSGKFGATPPIVSLTLTPTLPPSFTKTLRSTETVTNTPTAIATISFTPTQTATTVPTSQPFLDVGFVNKFLINARDKPNGTSVGELRSPQPVTILQQQTVSGDQWYFCEWNINGITQQGWILAEYITIISETLTPSPIALVTTNTPTAQPILDEGFVNTGLIHPQDKPNGKWIGELRKFQPVSVLNQQPSSGSQWYFCEWNMNGITQQGWILAEYITIGSTPTPRPTITP